MTITLNGTTGITTPDITSAAGLDAADLTGTVASARLPAGSVIQVVSAVSNGNAFSFSSGYNNPFGPSASIALSSASNNVLIIATGTLASYSTTIEAHVDILFNGTRLSGGGSGDGLVGYRGAGIDVPYTISYIHNPATTAAVTYAISGNYVSGSAPIYNGTRASDWSRITLMEIVA